MTNIMETSGLTMVRNLTHTYVHKCVCVCNNVSPPCEFFSFFYLFFVCFFYLSFFHSSCAGAPGGLNADGQRKRMAGCGAPSSSVSRSFPSILPTSPAKRLRRCFCHSLSSCPNFSSHFPFFFAASPSSSFFSHFFHVHTANKGWVPLSCLRPWVAGLPAVHRSPTKNYTPTYYNRAAWLCTQQPKFR